MTDAILVALEAVAKKHGPEIITHFLKLAAESDSLHIAQHPDGRAGIAATASGAQDAATLTSARVNLEEAWRLTHGNRKAAYGDVRISFARYAKVWSGLLGDKLRSDLSASDVALLMTSLKLAREMNKQQSDNVTDAHGYLILHDEIKEAEREG